MNCFNLSHPRCWASVEGAEDHGAQSVQWDQPVTRGHPQICPRRRPVRSSVCQVDQSFAPFFFCGGGWVVQFGKFMTEEWLVARENFHIFKWKTFQDLPAFSDLPWQNGDFGRWDEIYQGQWFLRRVRAAKVEREELQCLRGHAENIQASTCTDVACFFLVWSSCINDHSSFIIFYLSSQYIYVWFVYSIFSLEALFFFFWGESKSLSQAGLLQELLGERYQQYRCAVAEWSKPFQEILEKLQQRLGVDTCHAQRVVEAPWSWRDGFGLGWVWTWWNIKGFKKLTP